MTMSHTLQARVKAIRLEAERIFSIELSPLRAGAFQAFTAGAHVDLHLPSGVVRSYSLLNAPDEVDRYVIAVMRAPASRGGSAYLHEQLRVGQVLTISQPRNHFQLDASASRSVLVAGGIGITPIYCMYRELTRQGRQVELIYCARSRADAAFIDDIGRLPGEVTYHFDDEHGGPPDLLNFLRKHPADTHFYCCGPTPMLDTFERTCEQLGFPHAHIERFTAAEVVPSIDAREPYEVELRRSGKKISVGPGDNLLEALLSAGCVIENSCREGVCGSCETRVLAGDPDHRDGVLSKAERAANKSMMVCVSGCRSKSLVLDL